MNIYKYIFLGNTSTDEDDQEVENIASNRKIELENEVTTKQQQHENEVAVVSNSDGLVAQYDETSTDASSSDIMGEEDAIRVSRDEVFHWFKKKLRNVIPSYKLIENIQFKYQIVLQNMF